MAIGDYWGVLQGSVPDLAAQNLQEQQINTQRQNAQTQAGQLQLEMQKSQQILAGKQAFQADVTDYLAHPTNEGAAKLLLRHPDMATEVKAGHDLKDKSQQDNDVREVGAMIALAGNGDYKGAADRLQTRIDADTAAGHPDPDDQRTLAMLRSPNEAEQKMALGLMKVHLFSTVGSERASAFAKAVLPEDKPYTLDAGAVRFDGTNKIVAQSPFMKGPDGKILERDGMGTDAPSATSGTANPSDVWSRMVGPDGRGGIEGGTNSDGSFRTSTAGAIGPAQVMPGTAPQAAKLAGLAYNEQRYRSDPAYNLALGKAYYQKQLTDFGDPILAAAAYNAGPGRVKSAIAKGGKAGWVEHLPAETRNYVKTVAGGASASPKGWHVLVPGKDDAPSGYRRTPDGNLQFIPGGPSDPSRKGGAARRMTPQEVSSMGLDASTVYFMGENGMPQAVSGQDKKTAGAKQISPQAEGKVKPVIDTRDNLNRLKSTFKPEFGGHWLAGGAINTAQGVTSMVGPEGMRDWWADWNAMDNQVRNQLFGSALTAQEKAAYESTTISPRMDPKQIQKNVTRRTAIINAVTARTQAFMKKNKYDPEAVDALFAPLGGGLSGEAPAPAAQAVRVRSVQEAQRLPSGTMFTTPDGRTMRKK